MSAVPSEWRSATAFGTSSPITTWKKVRMRYASAIAVVVQLDDPRAAGGDETVFGRHEEGVQQDENADTDELEQERHAPTPGAPVLGGISSSNWRQPV